MRFVPAGTELDLWNGKCFVSLIGFMFINTKLLGIKVPFHANFEEVNLRFYVKRYENGEWKRGVVFIKEIVPKKALTFVANTIYGENYETWAMSHKWIEGINDRTVAYYWRASGVENSITVKASKAQFNIEEGIQTEFITEHYWGYARINEQKTNAYDVTHPKWKVYQVFDYNIDVDFRNVYGDDFEFLNAMAPDSVMLAEGSKITVESKTVIKTGKH